MGLFCSLSKGGVLKRQKIWKTNLNYWIRRGAYYHLGEQDFLYSKIKDGKPWSAFLKNCFYVSIRAGTDVLQGYWKQLVPTTQSFLGVGKAKTPKYFFKLVEKCDGTG